MKVTASITKGTTKVKGTSRGVFDLFHGDVAANQVYVSILKAFNTRSGGSAAIKTTIKGVRANGKPFTLSYSDHYADPLNVAYDVADATYSSVDRWSPRSSRTSGSRAWTSAAPWSRPSGSTAWARSRSSRAART
jgi:hypothetical protein